MLSNRELKKSAISLLFVMMRNTTMKHKIRKSDDYGKVHGLELKVEYHKNRKHKIESIKVFFKHLIL